MKRVLAAVTTAVLVATSLVACTPKPNSAEPIAEEFLAAFAEHNNEALSTLVDDPQTASGAIDKTFAGLQAEALNTTLNNVEQEDNVARATYTMTWDLPRDRELSYDTSMTLTQTGDEWTVRWQPSLVHPRLGAHQHLELRPVPAEKASVISSDGAELLKPGVAYRLLVDTEAMKSAPDTAQAISSALAVANERDGGVPTRDAGELTSALENASGTYSVAMLPQAAGKSLVDELAALNEIRLNEEAAMVNADPKFAPDIMARVGNIVRDELEGSNGWKISMVNTEGAALEDLEVSDPVPAPAIKVSLDQKLQRAAEEALAPIAGQQAVIVAIRPSTGQILAIAQTPAADKEGNLGLTGQYPPGSVFKIVTAAAGIEHQGITPGTIVPCPGTMDIYGRVVTNYEGFALGNVPLDKAFASSCNTTFADISTQLEPGQLQQVGKQFGLGIDYNISGLETITGSIPEGETPLERTEAGYGQGYDLASPFGLAMVAASAAHGSAPVPYLIEGQETKVSEEVPALPSETLDQVRGMMRSVVTTGTARGMTAEGEIYGKTGEAEIFQGSHSWFAGYRDDIAFASLVVLGGGSSAAVGAADRMLLNYDAADQPAEAPAEEEILQ
ncbi:penicillin-binding transpeptidase domain-containing protein [Corynebacterium breve]|uniref:Penicillin-binding transpeptidase domain-containing protein n=1 Tax=Corynebacterium breve TaxID=3049799 RepID=A0ABY8VDQ0_9CORY|nr:penicillin-binding transpeptidase domain-containing protein [Corynebacterium breve]WIM66865.1 penicillin-binding transpeptidase domain-containing protein [Corynebacterium breve]